MTNDEIRRILLDAVGGSGDRQVVSLPELLPAATGAEQEAPGRAALEVVAGGDAGAGAAGVEASRQLGDALAQLTQQVTELRRTSEKQADGIEDNTKATLENTVSKLESVGGAVASTAGSVLSSIGSTLTLSPVVKGLMKLFGGGKQEELPELPVYLPPSVIQAEGAPGLTGSVSVDAIRYGQDGLPRRVTQQPAPAAAPITIQVQAIDSRSFLDHSDSIARAVREAMLNSHALNDVVTDL